MKKFKAYDILAKIDSKKAVRNQTRRRATHPQAVRAFECHLGHSSFGIICSFLKHGGSPVSYTHLTLPTILLV